jgi:methylmalonyl-CoA/ethylmalonyl-CoA epimerase
VIPIQARVAHIGVAIDNLDAAVAFYRDVLGLRPGETQAADGATIVPFQLGEVEVELMLPTDPESPVAKFLARRGPGIHHMCFRVSDLEAALARCRVLGYRLVDQAPRPGAGGRRVAFVHPKSTAGILLELTDDTGDHPS